MTKLTLTFSLAVLVSSAAHATVKCDGIHSRVLWGQAYVEAKAEIKQIRPPGDHHGGLVQLTGKDLKVGQTVFPHRTPADPVVFKDPKTGEVLVYGTQVDGTGFSYLKYRSMDDFVRGEDGKIISKNVYLPNGQLAQGKEAVWDTYRLSYDVLKEAFSEAQLRDSYKSLGLDVGSDLYYGGLALQETGELGRWTTDNWRRRVHAIGQNHGELKILENPVFNSIQKGASEKDYPGFGHLPFLPGNYIGHAYGPNFKLVKNGTQTELWIISEEVTRRVNETGVPAEVTEIVARKMLSPFEASHEKVLLVSVNGPDGKPHPDSDRGPELGHTKLIEGFRPTSVQVEGIRITKRQVIQNGKSVMIDDPSLAKDEYFLMTGSSGNFAGDGYDARVAYRKSSAIGPYQMMLESDGVAWKGFLRELKLKYRLSWAGRGDFVETDHGWSLVFHATDIDLKPDGSYTGVIPPNTQEYHRNIYQVPVQFFINHKGVPDMRLVLDRNERI